MDNMGYVGVFIWQHWLFISPAEPTSKGGDSAGRFLVAQQAYLPGWQVGCRLGGILAGWQTTAFWLQVYFKQRVR